MYSFNPFTGSFDKSNNTTIPEFDSDPVSPGPNSVWVRRTLLAGASEPIGLLLALTNDQNTYTYELSFMTRLGTIVRVWLS